MKHLVIYCHPSQDSFNNAVKETFIKARENNDDIKVRDLYALGFDPVLKKDDIDLIFRGEIPGDIMKEQEYIRWADILTFIYPVWWMDFPAMLHGYIDRVFSHGFAYEITENGPRGLLNGKKVFIINTTGGTEEDYKANGLYEGMSRTIDAGKFMFCGLKVVGHKYLYAVPSISDQERKTLLEEVSSYAEEMV